MPGLPSTVCDTESPTGSTKQLIKVASSEVPASSKSRSPTNIPTIPQTYPLFLVISVAFRVSYLF